MKVLFRLACFGLGLGVALPFADAAVESTSRLVNLSTRAFVGDGADVLIAGFVVDGSAPKNVLIRALGPAIGQAGVNGALHQVRLQVFDRAGRAVTSNDRWSGELKASFARVGASMLPDNSGDAALQLSLAPGNYTAQVNGLGAKGIALVEIYEVDGAARLLNLSTRARVETGDGILISGLVISGAGSRRVLIRALGPNLAEVGVAGTLADPMFTVMSAGGAVLTSNDNWQQGGSASHLPGVSAAAGAGPLKTGSKDAALIAELPPGIYSIHVRGRDETKGVALLEAYDVTAITTSAQAVPVTGPYTPYTPQALSWSVAEVSARLGPTFEALNPGARDDRPTIFTRESKMPPNSYYVRIKPYELGEPGWDNDYWSDTGQVGYVPDDPVNDPGLDRIQLYAYYNRVFAISPRFDWPSGKPHPDPQTREPYYVKLNGGTMPLQPVAMVRGYGMQQNEQLTVYRDGLFAVAGMQTSRNGSERPYPGFKFPAHKVPRGIAVTTSNEFALVTIWDTQRNQGQLAVVALEGKYLPFHTWPYMGLPNQGSFSDFKLLGYIDLPMKAPEAVAAASNGLWRGPSSTDNKVLSQIDLSNDGRRALVYDGAWQFVVAKGGYAVVSSTEDNKAVVVDLSPLFNYMRESWLGSAASFQRTLAARGAAAEQFPQTFDVNPAIMPKVVWQTQLDQPTAVLAGQKIDRWTKDHFKAYVATRDGTIHILDTSSLMNRNSWELGGALREIGTFQVGRNPVSMVFTRRAEGGLPLIPYLDSGEQRDPDPYNNQFYVACRGDRCVDAVVTFQGKGQVYRRIRDSRMGDPVALSTAVRGNILTVADFAGKKLISFRMGTLVDSRNNQAYPPGDPRFPYEFAGELLLTGSPFLVNSANLN